MRPVLTGWFAEFTDLEQCAGSRVAYGSGAAAFIGATYDPTSHYRGAAVFAFHAERTLTPANLRQLNRHQLMLIERGFSSLDVDPAIASVVVTDPERRGGFLAIRAARAQAFARELRRRGVLCDARGDLLRLGPAPYLRDDQLRDAVGILGEVLRAP
jgi:kynureninase